jgi:RNA polymerase sigma-70 factor (ECF subfamily)
MQSNPASDLPGSWEKFLEPEKTRDEIEPKKLVLDLYDREQVPLRRYLMFLGLVPESAEEFVQEAFLRLHQHLLSGGERSNLRAWLYRVVHNLAVSDMQAARNRLTEVMDAAGPAGQIVDHRDNPEEVFLADQRYRSVRAALSRLPELQRRCLVLRSQGLKYREIAEVLGLSTSTVGEHVQRGINQVKEGL